MSEAQQPATPQAPAAPAATPEPQLSPTEQVYKEFGVEEQASQFQPESPRPQAPQPSPAVPTPKAPDPFSPEFPTWLQQQQQGTWAVQQALDATRKELGTLRQELHHERTEADIKRAVGTLAEKSGLDPKFTEVAFQLRAKEDPRLLQVWNNRSKNPKALEKALEAVAQEFKSQYTVKQDPQLVENQRAVRASQQQQATTVKESDNDKWAKMTYEERQKEVQKLLRAGGR